MGAKLDTGVGAKRGRPEVNAEPNVIPFIDVMLVLLIIFMVTSPIAVDVNATMPSSKVVASKREGKPVFVTLIDGEDCNQKIKGVANQYCPAVYVMEQNVPFTEIGPETLKALKKFNPKDADNMSLLIKRRIYLRASGVTRYKNVQDVMRRLQLYNLTKVALVTDDKNR